MPVLIVAACALCGAVSWCLAVFFFIRARRDYRGPRGFAVLLTPFAPWEPSNYAELGARRIRRSLLWIVLFFLCACLGVVLGTVGSAATLKVGDVPPDGCGPCRKELPMLVNLQKRATREKLVVLGDETAG